MELGLSSGVPGLWDIPEGNNDTHLAKNQVPSTCHHPTLGVSFPYEPGDAVYLESKGRIGLGCVTELCGIKYR